MVLSDAWKRTITSGIDSGNHAFNVPADELASNFNEANVKHNQWQFNLNAENGDCDNAGGRWSIERFRI
jgi:hypothetical protein